MRHVITTVLTASLIASGCATRGANYAPLVDTKGKDMQIFSRDIGECQQFAKQRMDAASGAAVGAVAGALLGALLSPRGYRNEVAGKTALLGGLAGAGEANESQESIIKRCLAGRGYNVLD